MRHLPKKLRTLYTKRAIIIGLVAVISILGVEDFLLTVNINIDRPILGVRLNGHFISGTGENLDKAISDIVRAPLVFSSQGQTYEVSPETIGARPDVPYMHYQLLLPGHQGSFFERLIDQNKALLGLVQVSASGLVSKEKLAVEIVRLNQQIAVDPLPPMPDFTKAADTILPGSDGTILDARSMQKIIVANIFHPPYRAIPIPILKVIPHYPDQKQELSVITSEARLFTARPLSIKSGVDTLTFTPADLRSMLTVVARPSPSNPNESHLELRLDSVKLNQRLGEFATKVESKTQAEFDDHDARVAVYAQFFSNTRSTLEVPTGNEVGLRKQLSLAPPADLAQAPPAQMAAVADALATSSEPHKFVYLTFDDGPNDLYHPLVLEILKKYNVKATFFLVGQNVEKYPDVALQTFIDGHEVGDHSLTHPFLPKLTSSAIRYEIATTATILEKLLHQKTTLFRPPYGGVDNTVQNDARQLNLKLVLWDVDPKDWSEPTTNELIHRVVDYVHSGSDVLMHSNHQSTVNALPTIIEKLKAEGYEFRML